MPTDLAELARSILMTPLDIAERLRRQREFDEAAGVLRQPHPFDSRYDYERCGVCFGRGYIDACNCAGCAGKGMILVERGNGK